MSKYRKSPVFWDIDRQVATQKRNRFFLRRGLKSDDSLRQTTRAKYINSIDDVMVQRQDL